MLSDEERKAIVKTERLIEFFEDWGMEYTIIPEDKKYFNSLLNLIEKQQKELGKEKERNKELENADLSIVYMNGFYDGEKKWKDKIKAKIEELNKEYEEYKDGQEWEIQDDIQAQISILEELLKGGKLSNE